MSQRHAVLFRAIIVLLLFTPTIVGAQSLLVYNIDASGFPTVRANVAVLDAQRNRIANIAPSDLAITEDGDAVSDITISCPPTTPPQPFNAVLVNDRSGSMSTPVGGGLTRMELARMGSSEFVLATNFSAGAAIAITAFESSASIVSDFQTSSGPLLSAISTITPSGGTLYNPPFLDPFAGAIGMLAGRPAGPRRVIVFLTDGQPNEPTQLTQIIDAANAANVQVYPITLGMPMSGELQAIADRTGGIAFGNVNTVDDMRAVYQQIALDAGGNAPCVVTWKSRVRCGESSRNRNVSVTHLPTLARGRGAYFAPSNSVGGFEATVPLLYFGPVGPPDELDLQVRIVATNDSLRIERAEIVPTGAYTIIDWGGPPPPFVEPPGSSRTITVRFAPPDSQKYVASLLLYGAPCPPQPVTLTGGVGRDDGSSLRLIAPLGGEAFSGCDSILVRWGGVGLSVPILIEASSDGGASWFTIATNAIGLEYRWMPPAPGQSYRIRISSESTQEQYLISTTAGGGESFADNVAATAATLLSPTGVAVRGDSMFIAESGMHRLRRVDLTTGLITTIAGDGNPGSNSEVVARWARTNNPTHVLLIGSYLFFTDYGNHRVRRINLTDNRIFTVAGTGESGFAGDGGAATAANLSFPSHLAVSGDKLYITDAANNRIRVVDLSSGIISSLSTVVVTPAGIAVAGDQVYVAETSRRRIRRIDLRTMTITTIAGTGASGSTGDGGQAIAATFMSPVGVEVVGDAMYVTDSAAHRVRRIDLVTGVITTIAGTGAPGFSGDGGDASIARLFGPGQPAAADGYLYVPDIRNGRIRAISIGRGPSRDSSRSSFRVSVPRLTVSVPRDRNLQLGAMAVGKPRDTSVVGAICNTGDIPLFVDSAHVIGAHAADFSIVSGAPSGEILPVACAPLEVRFRPRALGTRTAMVILFGRCANADTLWLTGVGVDSCAVAALDLADVGEVVLGADARDTVIERAICNTDDGPITGNATLASGAHAFAIVSGGGAFTLAPGECHVVKIRFSPVTTGRVTGEIDYGLPTVCGSSRTRLIGRALGAPALLVPDLVGFGGDICAFTRDTTIMLRNAGSAPVEITGATFIDNDEGFALTSTPPSVASPLIVPPGDSASLAIRFAPAAPGAKSATLELATNSAGSPQRIAMSGRRELAQAATEPMVVFAAGISVVPHDTTIAIRNDGTVAIQIVSGATSGGDAASFDLPAGQFPLTIAPGASAGLNVRLLAVAAASTLRTDLVLTYGPTCDSGRIVTELVSPGSSGELTWDVPELVQLCPDDTVRDAVMLRNIGGSPVDIDWARIENDPAGAFAWEYPLPVWLASGEAAELPVRFVADAPGIYRADVVLGTIAGGELARIPLVGRRERAAISASTTQITVTATEPGIELDGSLIVTSSSTVPVEITLATATGLFAIDGSASRTLGVGGATTIVVRITPTTGGRHRDTLLVREAACGTTLRIPLDAAVALPAVARLSFPHVTARPGQTLTIPVSIAITDAARFAASGAMNYTATVSMYGTVFVPDSILGARLERNDYDMTTRTQTLVFSGRYDGGVVLASIHGRALLGDTLGTPLMFENFVWDVASVGAELVDGSVTVVGSCLDVGLRLVAAPKILKLRPLPAADDATLDVELDEWLNVRVVLYDGRGVPVRVLTEQTLDAGRSEIAIDLSDIPSGVYALGVETAYGRSVMTIVVRR
jgi:hypothetical protein